MERHDSQLESEAKVGLLLAAADANRCLAEEGLGEHFTKAALDQYQEAISIQLSPECVTRLDLANNFSLFAYEVLKDSNKAISISSEALNLCLDKLQTLKLSWTSQQFQEIKAALDLLKENLSLFKD